MNDQRNTPDNTDDSEWEGEMSSEFERRVRDLHEAPLTLDSVKGKAMNIRTKRRAAVAGSVLAAAAVIVPVAVLANGGDQRADGVQVATQTPTTSTPSSSPTDPVTSDPTSPTGTDVPDDLSLGFDYLEPGDGVTVLHEGDGGVLELPGTYTDAADLGGIVAAYRQDKGGNGAVDIVQDGAVTTTYDVRGSMVVTPTGSAVAFLTTDDELLVVNASGEPQSLGTQSDENVYLAAIIGDGDCALESGCHPFLNDGSLARAPYEINYEGPETDVVGPDAVKVNDAADGFLVTAQLSYSDTGSCGALWDRQQGQAVFETCDAQVLDISPQGDYVTGTDPYGDGIGPGYFSILDGTTGKEVARYAPEQGFIGQLAWADDTHAVATVYGGAGWEIVSLGTDGSIETLVGPVLTGDEAQPAFYLAGAR